MRRPGPEFGPRRSRVHGVPLALLAAALCASPSLAAAQTEPTAEPKPAASEGAPPLPDAPPPPAAEAGKQADPPPANDGAKEQRRPDAGDVKPAEPKAEPPKTAEAPKAAEPPPPESGFFLGSYGRVGAATDFRKRPGRDADIVARGSRLDESPYFELDVQRQDYWKATGTTTRAVITLGTSAPLFHYNADFNIRMAVRNLFLQANNIVTKGLSAWVGSRMYRGDDAYLIDYWPLDNLNTMGGGLRYDFANGRTFIAWHAGLNQPRTGFFSQTVTRTPALNQVGATNVNILDRQKFITSLKASHVVKVGETAGVKAVFYGELHDIPSGQRETEVKGTFQTMPADFGYVVGAQFGAFTGRDASHVNLFIRYAGGAAAYGEFGTPFQLAPDRTSAGARELWITLSGNWETGPLGLMAAGYFRSFRDASTSLDYNDVDEGIIMARPHFFLTEWGGIATEISYQAQQRGVRYQPPTPPGQPIPAPTNDPVMGGLFRIGLVPFLNPAGKGSYSRPQLRLIYLLTHRDEGARSMYPKDDVFSLREWEHFFGVGVEWWFNAQTTYGG
ncbi:carbohydrate porin [Polyangium jinanense]|uniref:Carbohydrate porin n=1 Tax=Polyangium jinanense TaxID=2829994 RepID=A0A9X4AR75_9BACT|nr:carbohydrate porin [Polyangium jinanense]MDC3953065.1 carbohydrate porin [Polyangium jinanense]MDC3979822.1 carbohydrate porin [Polyangium jinanense]